MCVCVFFFLSAYIPSQTPGGPSSINFGVVYRRFFCQLFNNRAPLSCRLSYQEWPEIKDHLHNGQTAFDRAELCARVFKQKLDVLLQVNNLYSRLLLLSHFCHKCYNHCCGRAHLWPHTTTSLFDFYRINMYTTLHICTCFHLQVLPHVFGRITYRIAVIEFQVNSLVYLPSCLFSLSLHARLPVIVFNVASNTTLNHCMGRSPP